VFERGFTGHGRPGWARAGKEHRHRPIPVQGGCDQLGQRRVPGLPAGGCVTVTFDLRRETVRGLLVNPGPAYPAGRRSRARSRADRPAGLGGRMPCEGAVSRAPVNSHGCGNAVCHSCKNVSLL
jgi:hypothetical protein